MTQLPYFICRSIIMKLAPAGLAHLQAWTIMNSNSISLFCEAEWNILESAVPEIPQEMLMHDVVLKS